MVGMVGASAARRSPRMRLTTSVAPASSAPVEMSLAVMEILPAALLMVTALRAISPLSCMIFSHERS